jgi:hypothetical protein
MARFRARGQTYGVDAELLCELAPALGGVHPAILRLRVGAPGR